MQRLGYLKWLLRLASASRPQTLESITRAFFVEITKQISIPADRYDEFHNYLRAFRQEGAANQMQDLYLSDPLLPAHTGAITGDLDQKGYRHSVYVDIPTWATRLRFLRDRNYTVTDRGRALLLMGEGFESSPKHAEDNLLYLNAAERYVALFSLLDADGDLLVGMYVRLVGLQTFTRAEAGNAAMEALMEIRATRLKNAGAGASQQLRIKADRTITAIQNQKGGGLGPRDSIATPRTEPFVDCGILCKTRPNAYEYSFSEWGRSFLSRLTRTPSVNEFLQTHLSSAMAEGMGKRVDSAPSEGVVLECVQPAYERLRSGLGYVSLRELAVSAAGLALKVKDRPLLEVATIEAFLKRLAGDGSRHVRLALSRTGGLSQVRIDTRAFQK